MSETIEFSNNYSDLSTDRGFQFEFHCNRCGTAHRTHFQASTSGTVSNALDAASSLFGGVFSSAANLGNRVHSAGWQKAHDQAFITAVQEIKPEFAQCPHCSQWVCRDSCWNNDRGMCKSCAPDIGVEMSAAQASRTVAAIWENAAASIIDKAKVAADQYQETVRALCPSCNKPLPANVKFCPECGAPVKRETHCTECGAKLAAGTKFCPECGTKVATS